MKDSTQEQLATARRHQILDAAAKVFAAKGFHPATIKDIAREAGIADGTVYIYFANKTALLFGILDRMKAAALEDNTAFSEVNDFRSFVKIYLEQPLMAFRRDNFELFRVVISEIMVNEELRRRYYQHILEPTLSLAEPHFALWVGQGIDVRLTLRAISGMILGLMLEHVMGDELLAAQWDELPDFLTDLILKGITR
jgi:AcrR family transcriptional regulator